MFIRRVQPNHLFPARAVRPVAAGLILTLAIGMLGVPLPVRQSKPSNERFPCEACPCGCSTADYCWDKCCCHTDEEKLAWADRNGVAPPAFLVARVEKRCQQNCCVATNDTEASDSSCCSRKSTPPKAALSCCGERTNLGQRKASARVGSADGDHETGMLSPKRSPRVVLLDAALKCRGIDVALRLLKDTWIPGLTEPLPVTPPLLARLIHRNETMESRSDPPDGPVPRWVSC